MHIQKPPLLGWTNTGVVKPCKSCAFAKAKQKNVPKASEHVVATEWTKSVPGHFVDQDHGRYGQAYGATELEDYGGRTDTVEVQQLFSYQGWNGQAYM